MNVLSNSIYTYYFSHFGELTLDKQFHFACRLYAVGKDERAKEMLHQLKTTLIGDGSAEQVLSAIYSGKVFPLLPGNSELLQTRAPFIKKYPQLRDMSRILYWSAMLSRTYKFESKEALTSLLPANEFEDLYQNILEDHEAIAKLSTHAVNYLYLYKRYYKNERGPDPILFSKIVSDGVYYDYSDPVHLRLAVYMITHALIADTLFYFEPVPKDHMLQHRNNIEQLEALISSRLDLLSLDTKLEFVLCCKLVGHTSLLEPAIMSEAESSVSSVGAYLTAKDPNDAQNTLQNSEHRNALYIMILTSPDLR